MHLKINHYFTLILTVCTLWHCSTQDNKPVSKIRKDFEKYYHSFDVEGCFMLYNRKENSYLVYRPDLAGKGFLPASTFKICNSMIGLETGVISDENFVIPWDSVLRQKPEWNADSDLKNAFKNSTVWYYQELARRVGPEKMKYWLDKADYGNKNCSGQIDQFWLSGKLRISAQQQIDFLKRLHDNELPFSKRSMAIVKKIMITQDTLNYVLRSKTGWSFQDNKDIGWNVGYVETQQNEYYFANFIQSSEINNDFARARTEIAMQILKDLKIIAP